MKVTYKYKNSKEIFTIENVDSIIKLDIGCVINSTGNELSTDILRTNEVEEIKIVGL